MLHGLRACRSCVQDAAPPTVFRAGGVQRNAAPNRFQVLLAGQGKRGEQGYLAYLLRQAQAATRLSIERSLAGLGVTPPQFVVLTMLRAYPGQSGADLARSRC